jgi:chemotaxis protein MotB
MDFQEEPHSAPSHDRWLISYADFITLLFAVFVVLFTSAYSGKDAARTISEAVMNALKTGTIGYASRRQPNADSRTAQQKAIAELLPSLAAVNEKFQKEIAKGQVEIRLEPRGLVISLRQAAFFESAKADINKDALPTIDKVAQILMSVPNPAIVEGHTDAVPIKNSRFSSNWELSAARSIAMLDVLIARGGVPRNRLSIAGFADTMPLDSNEDPQGRAHNRRVDVVILNEIVGQDSLPKSEIERAKEAQAKPAPEPPRQR